MLDISLISLPMSVAFWTLLVVGMMVMMALGTRHARVNGTTGRWWFLVVPGCIAAACLITVLIGVLVEVVVKPFPDALPRELYVWIMLALAGVFLGIGSGIVSAAARPLRRRAAVTVMAVIAVVLGAAGNVNRMYAEYPTVGTVLGISDHRTVTLDEAMVPAEATVALDDSWRPASELPDSGAVTDVPIPGAVSGFEAQSAKLYLPPAYFDEPRPLLPVLVLMAGQPGEPKDWVVSGQLPSTMDEFAAQNDGLAPIVVVADPLGAPLAQTLCVDSPKGNAHTYLTRDVPEWIHDNLQAADGPASLAIGGLSFGGTCALQFSLTAPAVYPTFLAMSAQSEPTAGTRTDTVNEFFGGDEGLFRANNPVDLLSTRKYVDSGEFPDVAGSFVVGSSDSEYLPAAHTLHDAAVDAGIEANYTELPGGHSYAVWSEGLRNQLPWLAQRMGIAQGG